MGHQCLMLSWNMTAPPKTGPAIPITAHLMSSILTPASDYACSLNLLMAAGKFGRSYVWYFAVRMDSVFMLLP